MAGGKLIHAPVGAATLKDRKRHEELKAESKEERPPSLDRKIWLLRRSRSALDAWLREEVPDWQRFQVRVALARQLGAKSAQMAWQRAVGVEPPGWRIPSSPLPSPPFAELASDRERAEMLGQLVLRKLRDGTTDRSLLKLLESQELHVARGALCVLQERWDGGRSAFSRLDQLTRGGAMAFWSHYRDDQVEREPKSVSAVVDSRAPQSAPIHLVFENAAAVAQRMPQATWALRSASPNSALGLLGQGQGARLPDSILQTMHRLFGRDFGDVHVHAGPLGQQAAESLHVHAVTAGRHLYFAPGKYQPATAEGQALLIRQLSHVLGDRSASESMSLADADRATRVRQATRLYRDGELGAALRRGDGGLADAVAAALHEGAIVAPHPTEVLRKSAQRLVQELTDLGRRRSERNARRAMASSESAAGLGAEEALETLSATGGASLPADVRVRMEALFGHRFGHVRIHTDDAAANAAQAAGAKAVTIGSQIYFNRGQFAPGSEAGDRLLLHELTHVVQHDEGRLTQPTSGRVELSAPSDGAEHEARAMESRASVAPAAGSSTADATAGPPESPKPGKRASASGLPLGEWVERNIEGLVRRVAPGLANLIHEGPQGLIKQAIEPAVSGWVGTLTRGVNAGAIAGSLKESFSAAFGVLQGAREGDPKCCETLVNGINAIREVAHAFMHNPVMDAIRSVLTKVSNIFVAVTKLVAGPAFEELKHFVGSAGDAITSVASTIRGWLKVIKDISTKAFDWVAQKLGFAGGTGENGLVDWLKEKAVEAWDVIRQTLQPVIGPLRLVAGSLLALTGLPEIYLIIKYGPQLAEAVQWLWANRNNPEAVKKNAGGVGGSILPKILDVGQTVVGLVRNGASWLVAKVDALMRGAFGLLTALRDVPVLGAASHFALTIFDGISVLQQWAAGPFTTAGSWLEGLYERIAQFIKPYAEVLRSVPLAVANPSMIPGLVDGSAWGWLPDCIKPPLIDLLLDGVITLLETLPMLSFYGPLWALLRAGVLGFLRAMRAKDPPTKIAVSNKLAKIISGGSPQFLLGFVKGLLKGVWEGIKMPFEAIWLIIKGLHRAVEFFDALAAEADGKPRTGTERGAGGTLAAAAKQQKPTVNMPAVITPDQAPSVVARVATQLNEQKPQRPRKDAASAAPRPAADGAMSPEQRSQLGQDARRIGGELAGPVGRVEAGFWPAMKELFSSGKGITLDELMAKLGKVWAAAKAAIAQLGAKIADIVCEFLLQEMAEEKLGETIGELVGMVAFQMLLDYLSAGSWKGAMAVLGAIAKFLNWPMAFLGEAAGLLKKLGGFILRGIKQLGSVVAEAGAGALREVVGAFSEIGTKLGEFADDLLAKFGGKTKAAEAEVAERDAAKAAEGKAAAKEGEAAEGKAAGEKKAAEKEAQKAEELVEAIEISKAVAAAEDAGHVPALAIAASLDALEARYSWIKRFEARPAGKSFDIYLIASEHHIKRVGDSEAIPRTAGPRGLEQGATEVAAGAKRAVKKTTAEAAKTTGKVAEEAVQEGGEVARRLRFKTQEEAQKWLSEIGKSGEKLSAMQRGEVHELTASLRDLSEKGLKIPDELSERLKNFFGAFRNQHVGSNPILAEAWDRCLQRLFKSTEYRPLFDAAGKLKPNLTEGERALALDAYAYIRSSMINRELEKVVVQLEAEFKKQFAQRIVKLPENVEIHHLLYKAIHPQFALTKSNLLLARRKEGGGLEELHDLAHLISSCGGGNRWRTLEGFAESWLKDFWNIM